ncbi:MAG: hypothetical protein HQK83_19925 [Fibrobacteria bacterium]|nr:hypothetical protein [Fibrobacteria bacterium]
MKPLTERLLDMKCNGCKTKKFYKTSPDNIIDARDCFVRHLPGETMYPKNEGCLLEFTKNGTVLNIETNFKPAA